MLHTTNYNYPIWEDNDIPTWLVGWNNTLTAIDADIKKVSDDALKANTDIASVEQQIANANDEINNLTAEVSDLTTTSTEHTGQISALQTGQTGLDVKVENLTTEVVGLAGTAGKVYNGILSANETTLAMPIDGFDDYTLVDIYTSTYGLSPLTVELRTASQGNPPLIVTKWNAQATDTIVAVLLRAGKVN